MRPLIPGLREQGMSSYLQVFVMHRLLRDEWGTHVKCWPLQKLCRSSSKSEAYWVTLSPQFAQLRFQSSTMHIPLSVHPAFACFPIATSQRLYKQNCHLCTELCLQVQEPSICYEEALPQIPCCCPAFGCIWAASWSPVSHLCLSTHDYWLRAALLISFL